MNGFCSSRVNVSDRRPGPWRLAFHWPMQPFEVFEPVLAGAPFAGHGRLPFAADADVRGAVERRGRQVLGRIDLPEDAFLDGQVRGRETDRLDQHLDLGLRVRLEELGERLFDVGPAADQLAVGVDAFALLGPLGGDGLGVALVERRGEIAGRRADRLGVGFAARRRPLGRSSTGRRQTPMARAASKPPAKYRNGFLDA